LIEQPSVLALKPKVDAVRDWISDFIARFDA
jgi:hypothetical protein